MVNILIDTKVPQINTKDVKYVEHEGQERKLLLAEDGTVYKVKRSKMENNVEGGHYV